ncbi:MAG: pyruvate, phosphate dikinase [candidate division Zixibacteria bacterium]|nr:pyruvate, phosphate dikinase [candidate division Zixibacteria bacterium]
MSDGAQSPDNLLWYLQERAKELGCLYRIEEVLNQPDSDLEDVCKIVIEAIPPGWQYPDVCVAKIEVGDDVYQSENFRETEWVLSSHIEVQDKVVGIISVYYTKEMPKADIGPYLNEEKKLLGTIADRVGHFIMYNNMKQVFQDYEDARDVLTTHQEKEWRVALNLLKQTDKTLYVNICRRMLNHLCWSGIEGSDDLLKSASSISTDQAERLPTEDNRPHQKSPLAFSDKLCEDIFAIADKHIWDEQILGFVRKWIQEDRLSFLTKVLSQNLPMTEAADAVRRYIHLTSDEVDLPRNTKRGIQIALIRRMLSDQMSYINVANDFIEIRDFQEILDKLIYPPDSHGRLGGKAAGLFLAKQVIKRGDDSFPELQDIKVPKTWYIASDGLLDFLQYNNLSEVVEQKYKDINQVRVEYPHIVQMFKNCRFPPEIVQGLSVALDDFKDQPLIVRSSSLLEDRAGSAFSGKYKSLFIANRGTKQERLETLLDAIAEVYASIFGPDPIEYRAERGLLDFIEEMGIIIQEVVGTQIGNYFIPSYAGVAFSRNEFRWSPRIKREDGLLRLVPGLGTRAVDRLGDDYPILIAPGQTNLRVNVTLEEMVRYSPKQVDVINLKNNTFETVTIDILLRSAGDELPGIEKMVSIYDGHLMRKPMGFNIDFEKDDLVVTFDGLISDNKFVKQIQGMLKLLEKELKTPVDIEFASDGRDLYILQCRPQSSTDTGAPANIPKNIPENRILFTANRYISNGKTPDITHVVYVDPQKYDEIEDRQQLLAVGRAVGKLNKVLPKRKFILMGPGRWGSRGDIKLGVNVTYSEINNTAVLIEVARQKGNYVPDLSFGTHFFQDLVEAEIRYLPLYPDDEGILFNEDFLLNSENILSEVAPECADLADVIRLIDVSKSTGGNILRVLMNAELEQAIGILDKPLVDQKSPLPAKDSEEIKSNGNYWAWRLRMAEYIARHLDPNRFGVKGFYVIGSTKNATAGPASDIDLLIHFSGTDEQREDMMTWLEGWSLSLDEMNYLETGYRTGGLLDIHIVTDEDIEKKSSYAVKIGAVTDAARPLPMKTAIEGN